MVGPRRTCTIVDAGVAQAARPRDPRAGRVDGRARAGHASADPLEPRRRRRGDAPLDLAGDLPASCSSSSASTARRSSSSTTAARAERLALRLNELADADLPDGRRRRASIARAHHGSLAREERIVVEELLKAGELPCLVATSSLELGIDMGAVDLVLQVESPKSVARGLQRIGRAGHDVGDTSARAGSSRSSAPTCSSARSSPSACARARSSRPSCPRNALDVLAQQIVAIAAARRGRAGRRRRAATRSSRARTPTPSCAASCSRTCSTCSTAATRRRSSASCAPRIVWDRVAGTIRAAQGRAPARGHQRRHDPRPRPVHASRCPTAAASASSTRRWSTRRAPGQTFLLGASTWRIEEIGRDRVIVTPAPGAPGAVPFWKGDGVGRPKELGEAIGAFAPLGGRPGRRDARARLRPRRARRAQPARLPARAAGGDARRPVATARSSSSASATRSATGGCASSRPYGGRVHAAWGLALSARIREQLRPRVRRDLVRRRDHRPPPRRRRAAGRRARAARARRGRGRASSASSASSRAVRRALPRERRPRAADPARLPGQAHAAVAAAAEVADRCSRSPSATPTSRSSSRPTASACATCSTCPGLERAAARAARAASCRSSRSRRRPPRRSPPRCSSTTSRRTCTRATRRTPSAAPPRCRSTATCCASCSARRSCAS